MVIRANLIYFGFILLKPHTLTVHETYMKRCIELALLGASSVSPNPMVGAVLVHKGQIIGEGYHIKYGEAHAEVNCIASVNEKLKDNISDSTLYVSLEPCAHYGKTPPCADLIVSRKIPEVVIGCRDPFAGVNGKGIEKLQNAGVKVTVGVLEKECRHINRRFLVFHTAHRPYIILKWAESSDGRIGNYGNSRLMISNDYTNRLVHRWRSEEMGIMVGTNTAFMDNPQLTNRMWYGGNPARIVLDMNLQLPPSLHLMDGQTRTIVFNLHRHGDEGQISYYQVSQDASMVHQVLNGLKQIGIMSVMIEGGARLLQSFIDEGAWDEARVITNTKVTAGSGVPAPQLLVNTVSEEVKILDDVVRYYFNEGANGNYNLADQRLNIQ
jgi:diaminohydroxyphosphoribosylaminopyrimidine deaminase / 5-amino-6-(5-phosphoribosylamino)uracil reductase